MAIYTSFNWWAPICRVMVSDDIASCIDVNRGSGTNKGNGN